MRIHCATCTALLTAVVGSLAPAAHAEAVPGDVPNPGFAFTGNFGIYSQYVFRGLTQTDGKPALQGGLDVAHTSGFYAGTWGSNVSWLRDLGLASSGGNLEWDFYAGYKHSIVDDASVDAGVLQYFYPGSYVAGATNPDTTEIYVAGGWKWLSLKYSHAVTNTFGVADSRNSRYVDLAANVPITEAFTLNAHVGRQIYAGGNGFDNGDALDYTDWKLGVTWSVNGWSVGAHYTDTNAKDAGYVIAGRNIGKATGTAFVQKTF
jgi:uncharacterized protein (TIGR02001 family)